MCLFARSNQCNMGFEEPSTVFRRMLRDRYPVWRILFVGTLVAAGLAAASPILDPVEPVKFGLVVFFVWFLAYSILAILPLAFRRYVRTNCHGHEDEVAAWSSREVALVFAKAFLSVYVTSLLGTLGITVLQGIMAFPGSWSEVLRWCYSLVLNVYACLGACLWVLLWVGLSRRIALWVSCVAIVVCYAGLVLTDGGAYSFVLLFLACLVLGTLAFRDVAGNYRVLEIGDVHDKSIR